MFLYNENNMAIANSINEPSILINNDIGSQPTIHRWEF